MITLYNAALLPLRPLLGLWAAWDGRSGDRRTEWSERRVRVVPRIAPGGIWLHGASAGEARLVAALAGGLRAVQPERSLAVSAVTRTGRALLPSPPEVDAAFFAPLDLAGYNRRLLEAMQPALVVLVETELWPNLLREAGGCRVPVVLVNARLSPERMGRYRRFVSLYRPLLTVVERVAAQTDEDARRFVELGVSPDRVGVAGNIKYDLEPPEGDVKAIRERLGLAADRPVFVAGSTGAGEDGPVLDAFEAARAEHPTLFLVLAPRHPERAEDVDQLLASRGLRSTRLGSGQGIDVADADVLLVDSVGRLGELYRLAQVAFVGGSLVPIGGHNLLEPAALGIPVLFGPFTGHVAEPARLLEAGGGGVRVRDGGELTQELARLLADPAARRETGLRAVGTLRANRGALQRNLDAIRGGLASERTAGVATR
jgi:3-deoxy-D-manno-octulosonic-acid transferase